MTRALLGKGRLGKCLQGQCEDSSRHLLDKSHSTLFGIRLQLGRSSGNGWGCPSLDKVKQSQIKEVNKVIAAVITTPYSSCSRFPEMSLVPSSSKCFFVGEVVLPALKEAVVCSHLKRPSLDWFWITSNQLRAWWDPVLEKVDLLNFF